MWPQPSELGLTARLRLCLRPNASLPPRPCCSCAADSTRWTAAAAIRSLHLEARRPGAAGSSSRSSGSKSSLLSSQRRWITQNYLRKKAEAEAQWKAWAEEIKAGKRKSFVEHLEERGLIHQVVGERDVLHRLFTEKRVGILQGREPMHSSVRKANMVSMHIQLKKLGACIEQYGIRHGYQREWAWKRALTNNNVWWNKTTLSEVLRDLGAYIRIGPMLGRDTVKTRLEKGEGMSFAEFTYPLMQAWDWWMLFKKGTQVQVGGSDQFGNILFGMDAVKQISRNTAIEIDRRPLEDELDKPIGFTTPLLTTPSGEKFGKSAGNAVWLDKDLTSTFELYQFWVRTPDADVERYLKMFTFLPLPKIAEIMEEQNKDPSKRVAQHALAREFVELVHGPLEAEAAELQHRQLFRPRSSTAAPSPAPAPATPKVPPNYAHLPQAKFWNPAAGNKYAPATSFMNMPNIRVTLPRSLVVEQPFHKVLYSAGLVSSKSEGHRLIANGGAYVGSRPGDTGSMSDDLSFTPIKTWPAEKNKEYILDDCLLILKIGKWKFKMVNIISDEEFDKQGLTAPGWEEFKQAKQEKENAAQEKAAEEKAEKNAENGKNGENGNAAKEESVS
ncbi:Tyrosine--tRNA ligase [Rasamsonia emersonii CBS 393.64]|uniref:Tyrosine--tRNA ligase n=1 Tax=Rasamsonia emersonii (strain ATCC 16479 / CBS 393.64 / IMI 116815) TaxID=1408163 RepID=A0A0F4YXK1_RASE3|nr:Tyrosine--tRNA ligase [Rasamsonia emersonii CBS 393.64]KKA22576.1 Tyrosine--tRNA ligase [Rasamsonia emersonii CBS 393.64]